MNTGMIYRSGHILEKLKHNLEKLYTVKQQISILKNVKPKTMLHVSLVDPILIILYYNELKKKIKKNPKFFQ